MCAFDWSEFAWGASVVAVVCLVGTTAMTGLGLAILSVVGRVATGSWRLTVWRSNGGGG